MVQGRAALVQSPQGDLVISQGADNTYAYRYSTSDGTTTTPVDLTGWQARAQVRPRPGGTVWLDLTSQAPTAAGSSITLGADGFITVHIHHAETEAAEWNTPARAKGVWDLELIAPSGEVIRLVMGAVELSADVTR